MGAQDWGRGQLRRKGNNYLQETRQLITRQRGVGWRKGCELNHQKKEWVISRSSLRYAVGAGKGN